MGKGKVSKSENLISNSYLTQSQVNHLLDSGLSKIQVANFIKKQTPYEKILKKLDGKVEENEARAWLKARFGTKCEIPKEKLPDLALKKSKEKETRENWQPINHKQRLKLCLPLFPSVNHMYQTNPHTGSRNLTVVALKFMVEMMDLVKLEVKKQNWEPTYKKLLICDMVFNFPDDTNCDSHNMFKLLFDVLDGIVMDNDKYILPRIQDLTFNKVQGTIELEIYLK